MDDDNIFKAITISSRSWKTGKRMMSACLIDRGGGDPSLRMSRCSVAREDTVSLKQPNHLAATCQCGKVEFAAAGAPIVSAACFCASCQEAGRRFEQLPAAATVLDPDGGTGFLLYRKDRVRCARGLEHLSEHRLAPDAATRRVVATCCNSPMFLEFTSGHWLSMYRNRFPAGAPAIEMRTMTKDRRAGVELADDVPNLSTHSGQFMFKLLAAWMAMGFPRPAITWGKAAP